MSFDHVKIGNYFLALAQIHDPHDVCVSVAVRVFMIGVKISAIYVRTEERTFGRMSAVQKPNEVET